MIEYLKSLFIYKNIQLNNFPIKVSNLVIYNISLILTKTQLIFITQFDTIVDYRLTIFAFRDFLGFSKLVLL